VQMWTYF